MFYIIVTILANCSGHYKHFSLPLETILESCAGPLLALLKIRALVQPNLQRWTGFYLLIFWGIKFWQFSFFKPSLLESL